MVKWLNKKDRARLQFEYHKGTIEARKVIIQDWFGWAVTYENFREDWFERIEHSFSEQGKDAGEECKKSRTKSLKRATPTEEYFWDAICRSIYCDQSYQGALGKDESGNKIELDPDSPIADYFPPLAWMLGHCDLMTENPPLSLNDDERASFYGTPGEIPHSVKTRMYQVYRLLRKFGKELFAPLGIAYILNLIRDLLLRSTL
ncbi:MAG: hypothetical protein OXI78_00960 [Anaerolineaceae bacterium]|nr:hypothetical protein [Anaerolineaceae bacterium]